MSRSHLNTLVLGYTPTPQGSTALQFAIAEARAHEADLIVVTVSRADSFVDSNLAETTSFKHWPRNWKSRA